MIIHSITSLDGFHDLWPSYYVHSLPLSYRDLEWPSTCNHREISTADKRLCG